MRQDTWTITLDYAGCGLESPAQPATLTSFLLDRNADDYIQRVLPAVIICPGGGYGFVAPREGEPVAIAFNALGLHAFVLNYSVAPMRFPGALMELSLAVAYVRSHAREWNIDANRIAVCGFSAGGHLAASLGVFWKEAFVQRFLGLDQDENQPNALVLSYPVISGRPDLVHAGSRQNLLGSYPDPEQLALFSLENQVSDSTPPTFLWHTASDSGVPAGNSLVFAQALAQREISYELHIYPRGEHGLSLANDISAAFLGMVVPECQQWVRDAARFVCGL